MACSGSLHICILARIHFQVAYSCTAESHNLSCSHIHEEVVQHGSVCFLCSLLCPTPQQGIALLSSTHTFQVVAVEYGYIVLVFSIEGPT